MNFDLALRLIDEIKQMRLTDEINFYVMGESLLHHRAIDIFRYAKEKGFKIKLNTNGSLLDNKMRQNLLSLGIENLFISYHDSYIKHNKYVKIKPRMSFEEWHDNIISTIEDKYRYNSPTTVTIILFKSAKSLLREQVENIRVYENEKEALSGLGVWLELGKSLAKSFSIPYLFNLENKNSIQNL